MQRCFRDLLQHQTIPSSSEAAADIAAQRSLGRIFEAQWPRYLSLSYLERQKSASTLASLDPFQIDIQAVS